MIIHKGFTSPTNFLSANVQGPVSFAVSAPGRLQWNFRWVIFKLILAIDGWGMSCETTLRWMPQGLTHDKSALVQVMASCRQATCHYLSHVDPDLSRYGVTRPQWVNTLRPKKWLTFCRQLKCLITSTWVKINMKYKKCTLSSIEAWGHFAFCRLPFFIWVRSRRCGCLVTWFCYHLIAKPGNKTAAHSWPEPYNILPAVSRQLTQYDTVSSVRLHDSCYCRPPFINIPASQSEEHHLWGNWTIEHMAEQATTAISANESSWMGEWMKEISITVKSLI